MSEIMLSSRDHVSRAQHLEVTYALKKLKKIAVVHGKFSLHLPLNFPLTRPITCGPLYYRLKCDVIVCDDAKK